MAQYEIPNGQGETVIYGFNPTSGYVRRTTA